MKARLLFFLIVSTSYLFASQLNNYPSLFMNPNGEAILVWQGYDDAGSYIGVFRASKNGPVNWSSEEMLSTPGRNSINPSVAINGSGQTSGVWEQADSSFYVRASTGTFDGSWLVAESISQGSSNDIFPKTAIDTQGNALSVWQKKVPTGYTVYGTIRSNGSWAQEVAISGVSKTIPFPQISMNTSGKAVTVWKRFTTLTNIIEASSYSSGNWSEAVALSNPSYNASSAQVALSDSNTAIAVWQLSLGNDIIIQTAVRSSEGVWGEASTLSQDSGKNTSPQIDINNGGKAVAIWVSENSTTGLSQIQAAVYTNGSWGNPVNLSDSFSAAGNPQICINNMGTAAATWIAEGQVQAAVMNNQNVWQATSTISMEGQTCSNPQIAIANSGSCVTAWSALVNNNLEIQSAFYTQSMGNSAWGTPTKVSN